MIRQKKDYEKYLLEREQKQVLPLDVAAIRLVDLIRQFAPREAREVYGEPSLRGLV